MKSKLFTQANDIIPLRSDTIESRYHPEIIVANVFPTKKKQRLCYVMKAVNRGFARYQLRLS